MIDPDALTVRMIDVVYVASGYVLVKELLVVSAHFSAFIANSSGFAAAAVDVDVNKRIVVHS